MKILFICKNNQFRSQMAMALFNHITGTGDADSAGTYVGSAGTPEGDVIEGYFQKPDFFELMESEGMHIRNNRMKKLSPEMIEKAERVISMAEEPFIPDFLRSAKKVEWWDVENPTFVTREVAEKTYKEINNRVKELIETLSRRIK